MPQLRELLTLLPERLRDMENLLNENYIWKARTVGVGYLDLTGCMALGITGPVLRSTGLPHDLRKTQPYCGYETYDFDVITDEDLQRDGYAAVAPYRVLLTGTHPEYTSTRMRATYETFTAQGGRLVYLGGNGFYWRISYSDHAPGAIEVRKAEGGIRAWAAEPGEYYNAFDGAYSGLWRRSARPPQDLVGVGFSAQGFDVSSYYRREPGSEDPRAAFIFEGISDEIIGDFGLIGGGAAGLELDRADRELGTPDHALVLASSEQHTDIYLVVLEEILINAPGLHGQMSPLVRADLVFFETAGGGAVFSTGSIAFCGSLSHNGYDNNVSRMIGNVVRRFADPEPFVMPGPDASGTA